MPRRQSAKLRAYRAGSQIVEDLKAHVRNRAAAERTRFRLLRFQSLEDRLALSAAAAAADNAPSATVADVDTVFAVAFVGTPLPIALPVQLTAGQYQIMQGPQHGTAAVNEQGQLVYSATDADDWDEVEILVGGVDGSGNPLTVDVQLQTVPPLPTSTGATAWAAGTTLQSDGTYQAQITDLYQQAASSIVGLQFLPSSSSYAAQLSSDSLAAGPQNGTVVELSPLNWVYTPNPGFTGMDQMTFNVHAADPNATPDEPAQFFDTQVMMFISVDTANTAPINATPVNAPPAAAVATGAVATASATAPDVAAPDVAAPVAVVPSAATNHSAAISSHTAENPVSTAEPVSAALESAAPANVSAVPTEAPVASLPVAPLSAAVVDAAFAVASGPNSSADTQAVSPAQPASVLLPVKYEFLLLA